MVTPDEFDCSQAVMAARVNGEERSRGNLADIYCSWQAILAQAAREHRAPGNTARPHPIERWSVR